MRVLRLILTCVIHAVVGQKSLSLPDGAELLIGNLRTSFRCPNQYGYFADADMDCKVFHVCNPVAHPNGLQEVQQFSFLCGNQTIFDQLSLSCAYPDDAIPCQSARTFFYLNGRLGQSTVDFHNENDIAGAAPHVQRYSSEWSPRSLRRDTTSTQYVRQSGFLPMRNGGFGLTPLREQGLTPLREQTFTPAPNSPPFLKSNGLESSFPQKRPYFSPKVYKSVFSTNNPAPLPRTTPGPIEFQNSISFGKTAGGSNSLGVDEFGRSEEGENTSPELPTSTEIPTSTGAATQPETTATTETAEESTTEASITDFTTATSTERSSPTPRQVVDHSNDAQKSSGALQAILSVGPRASNSTTTRKLRRRRVKTLPV